MALRFALRTVTILIVLGVALLGVQLYRMARPEPGAPITLVSSDASTAPALGKFNPLAEPRPAPDLSYAALSGATQSLAALRGHVVLVNFWATWCAPCIREMPSLVRLQEKFDDLVVLAVSEDRRGAELVKPFVADHHLAGLTILLDPENISRRPFNFGGLPTSFLIGRDGRIIGDVEGAAAWDSPEMLRLIRGYLTPTKAAKAG